MAASTFTKKSRRAVIILSIISALLMIGPALIYLLIGLVTATVETSMVIITGAVIAACVMTVVSLCLKHIPRTLPWIAMLALFLVIDHILVMVVIFAATQILDELVIEPLLRYHKTALIANKQIDKRG